MNQFKTMNVSLFAPVSSMVIHYSLRFDSLHGEIMTLTILQGTFMYMI